MKRAITFQDGSVHEEDDDRIEEEDLLSRTRMYTKQAVWKKRTITFQDGGVQEDDGIKEDNLCLPGWGGILEEDYGKKMTIIF